MTTASVATATTDGQSLRLDGKIALVTGGTAGIGRAIAEAFLHAGATVAVNGRNPGTAERVLGELDPELRERASFVQGDVTRQHDCERIVSETISCHGRLDILVNNAGGSDPALTTEITDEQWQLALDWNLNSTFWATRVALRDMLTRREGRIINISSMEGKVAGFPGMAAYVAAKHAVNGLTKNLAREVGPSGITVNAICPGLVMTDVVRDRAPAQAANMGITVEELIGLLERDAALQRLVTPAEIATMALLVASPAGSGITGATLSVDGGNTPY